MKNRFRVEYAYSSFMCIVSITIIIVIIDIQV